MGNIEILDRNLHADINIDFNAARRGPRRELIPVVVSEFQSLMFHYPIVFVKDQATGKFNCSILLGISAETNLLDHCDWADDEVLPLNIRRLPLVAVAPQEDKGQPLIGINWSAAGVKLQSGVGDYIFKNQSDGFDVAVAALVELHHGFEQTDKYVDKVLELDLVSKLHAQVQYKDKPSVTLEGLYGIDPNRISRVIEGDTQQKDAFLVIANYVYAQYFSLANMRKLARYL
ncbi:SapC family protein [Cellvibrio sp. NN19]|uniref:SapC family protein n=1 Tax=Cellvibrio chitinivorans TaxID=3102792 RepID=UPI002B402662|nr:SapC family protein [Cellvibrio sp. NN19]